jgi:hypothetical protein
MAWFACAVAASLAAAGPARAQGPAEDDDRPPAPIMLADPDALPFSNAELTQALLARLLPADEARPPQIRVAPDGTPGAVTVRVGDRSRLVALGERTGTAAARVVALVVAELMSDAAPVADVESDAAGTAPAAPAVTVSDAPPSASLAARPLPPAPGPARPPRLCVTGGVSKGTGAEELFAGTVDGDVALAIGPDWARVVPSVGLTVMPDHDAGAFSKVSLRSAAFRLLAGGGWGPLELVAGPVIAPYNIAGTTSHSGVLFGAEAVARLAVPLSGRLRFVAATRVDAYANRVRVEYIDGAGFATPRVGVSLGLGLGWDWAP